MKNLKKNEKTKLFEAGIISALLAVGMLFCTSCDNPAGNGNSAENEKPAEVTPKAFTISFNAIYGEGEFKTADDWASIEITFDEVPSTEQVQFRLISDSFEKKESWGDAYYPRYPQVYGEVVNIILAVIDLTTTVISFTAPFMF